MKCAGQAHTLNTEMADRKLDIKEAAIEGFYSLKEILEQFVEDFRSRDRFFKYKVGIVGAWLVTSMLTMAVSCGGGPTENSLRAHTQVARVLDDETVLIINDSSKAWTSVFFTLNDAYTTGKEEVPAGGKIVLPVRSFLGAEGQVPPKDLHARTLRIACKQGTETLDLLHPNGEAP